MSACDGDHDGVVVAGAERRHPLGAQRGLDLLEIDTQAVHLDESAVAADDLVQSVGAASRDVARAQRLDRLAERQVVEAVRVAHHHVGAAVDELADVVVGPTFQWLDRERSAADRPADCIRPGQHEFWWQKGHSGGRLGCAVHHEQLETLILREFGESAHALRWHSAAGLRHVAQVGQARGVEANALEQFEGVRHARE